MITKDSKNILVADDSVFFRTKLSDILMEAGHKVSFAKDGHEVIRRIEQNSSSIDLLVLDLQMPEVDGFGVLKSIEDNGLKGKFPVLVITGAYEKDQIFAILKNLGISGFMSKNYPPEQVVYWINNILFGDKIYDKVRKKRVAVSIPVDFSFGAEARTGLVISLSEGGLFVNTNQKLLEGTMLDLKFMLPGKWNVLHAKGIVRWFTTGESQSMFSGCGVMFTAISDNDREMIREFIDAEVAHIEKITATNKH